MKMKKMLQWFSAVAVVFAVGACQQQNVEPAPAAPVAPPAPSIPGIAVPTPEVSSDPMAQKMAAARAQHAADKVETSALMKATLEEGASQAYQVTLPGAPYCQAFVAVGAETLSNVDVKLALADGALVAADSTLDATAVISSYCPPNPGLYNVTVTAAAGAGEVAVQVFSK